MKDHDDLSMKKSIQTMTTEDAIAAIRKTSRAKFDSTLEVHFNLDIDPSKADQTLRVVTTLPHGTGKTKKVAVFSSQKISNADLELSEADIVKVEKGVLKPKIDFDVIVAEPIFMSKLAKIAKILGPAGVMPNPKNGTVTDNVEKAVEQIKKGKVELRNEANAPIVHTVIGKLSFSDTALKENFDEIYNTLKQNKPGKAKPEWIKNCFISATMSPSIMIKLD